MAFNRSNISIIFHRIRRIWATVSFVNVHFSPDFSSLSKLLILVKTNGLNK